MATSDGQRDGGAVGPAIGYLRRWWRAFVAEFLATALLVGLGVAAALPVHNKPLPPPLAHPAMAFGFVVLANAIVFGPLSGAHMNPAVTLAAVVQRQLSIRGAPVYLVAQTAGAMLGFKTLLMVVPSKAPFGCTLPGPDVTPVAAAALEATLTGLLVLTCCALWSAPPDSSDPIKLGLIVAGLVYSGGDATGASLNPVRSLAPAVFQGVWRHHWVYWAGPLCGSALAVLLYRCLLCPMSQQLPGVADVDGRSPSSRRGSLPEELPLHDKP